MFLQVLKAAFDLERPTKIGRYFTRLKIKLTTTITFGFTKLAILLFYKRIFGGAQRAFFNTALWIMLGLTVTWTVAYFFSNVLQC